MSKLMPRSVRPRPMCRPKFRQLDDHVQMLAQGKFVGLVLLLWLALAAVARADTITPTRFDDPAGAGNCPSDCSLRQAVNRPETTEIALGQGSYKVTQGVGLLVNRQLKITGAGAGTTYIDGAGNLDNTQQPIRIMRITGGPVDIHQLAF